jgi:hypothetical protein
MDLEEIHQYPSPSCHQPCTVTQFLEGSDTQGSLMLISARFLTWGSGLLSSVPPHAEAVVQLISPSFVFYAESLDPLVQGSWFWVVEPWRFSRTPKFLPKLCQLAMLVRKACVELFNWLHTAPGLDLYSPGVTCGSCITLP